jgi:iron complex transport system permease protein
MKINKPVLLLILMLMLVLILLGLGESGISFNQNILYEIRIPKILTCILAGGLLAIAGFLMQVFFQNPLAGPDILGVSSGSVLFVALFTLNPSLLLSRYENIELHIISFLGSLFVFSLLMFFIYKQKSKSTLLIIGILISYFVSSIVSILVNSSQALQLKSYLLWTQGSFRNVGINDLPLFLFFALITILPIWFFKKSLHQLVLGDDYAKSMGNNLKLTKRLFIVFSSLAVSITTVFCGPIGFVGVVGPFLAKKIIKKANINELLITSFLVGAMMTLFSEFVMTLFSNIPFTTNATLGIIGAPILVYFVYNQRAAE